MSNRVYTLGEALVDFVPTVSGGTLKDVDNFKKAPGGAPANVAVSVAKLGCKAFFIGKLGADAFGDFLVDTLRDEGVNCSYILQTPEAKTGLAFVSLREDGERDFIFYRNPSADMLLCEADIHENWFRCGDMLHFGSISLIQDPFRQATTTAIHYARKNGCLISYDPNLRLPLWPDAQTARTTILDHLIYADIVKISEEELEFLTGTSNEAGVRELFVGNVKLIVLTLGAAGSVAYTAGGDNRVPVQGFKVKAIDTTGAGDAFVAGILSKLMKANITTENFEQVLNDSNFLTEIQIFSNANGALASAKRGAICALPTLLEVENMVDSINSTTDTSDDEVNLLDKGNKMVWSGYENMKKCPYRLNYHIMAPTNWLNDPNGLIHFNGQYHVFYQHHPYSPQWGPMYWGHVTSTDLVHWQHQPIALAPDQSYEAGCFSGSAVDDNGVMTLVYTAHDNTRTPKELQCIATSQDGIHFTKYEDNPVVREVPPDASEDFRDPKVWQHEGMWYMVVGTGKGGKGRAVLYRSTDLRQWDYLGLVCESDGTQGDIWECPDIFSLGSKDVLIVSPMHMKTGKNICIIGNMDYQSGKFTQQSYHEADYGHDFYAAQTFTDPTGRRLLIAWMDRWGSKYPTQHNGWAGAMTIPRELKLNDDSTKVLSVPVEEMQKLRDTEVCYENVEIRENHKGYLDRISGDSLEIKARIKLTEGTDGRFGLVVRASDSGKEKTLIYYDVGKQEFIVDRSKSGVEDWNREAGKDYSKSCAKADLIEKCYLEMQIFIDRSSIEVFVNHGELVMSNRIYPDSKSIHYDLFAQGVTAHVEKLQAWKLLTGWVSE